MTELYVSDEKCCGCVIKSVCPTCYGANYQEFGNIYWQNESYCKLQKIIFKAISFFKGMQWEKKQIYVSEKEEALLLKSIEIIQKGL